jgi:outer membrane protein
MKRSSRHAKAMYLGLCVGLGLTLAACATHAPTWPPERVAPPATLEAGLEAPAATSAPESASEPTVDATAETHALILSPESAVQLALAHNRALTVQTYAPAIVETTIAEARATFDPTLTLSTSYSEQNAPVSTGTQNTSITETAGTTGSTVLDDVRTLLAETQTLASLLSQNATEVNTTETFQADSKLRQYLPTGTTVSLAGGVTQQSSNLSDTGQHAGAWSVGVTQSLLQGFGTGVNLVALRQARNNAAISEHAFREFVLGLVEQVEVGYWNFVLANETLGIREFSLDLVREQLQLNQALISVGKLAQSARVSAEAEVASQQAALVDAQATLKERAIDLWQLVNPQGALPEDLQLPESALPEITAVPLDPSTSVRLATAFRPDLAQARLDITNRELDLRAAKNNALPALDLFASYGVNSFGARTGAWNDHLADADYGQFEVGLAFERTLGGRAEKARRLRASLEEQRAAAAVRNLEQGIETEVRKAIVNVTREWERIAASQSEVAAREEELRIETDQFRLGRSTNLDVLQVQQNLVQAKLNEASAKVRYLQALVALYQAEGTLLTRRGIVLGDPMEMQS